MIRQVKLLLLIFIVTSSCSAQAQPAPNWKTGQTTCYEYQGIVIPCGGTGQDGELRKGVAWPVPRFTANGDCVTDNLTGLMWARNGNLSTIKRTWQGALDYVTSINSGSGLCGYHDWRLPNRIELTSLTDRSQFKPSLPLNHPFINVQFIVSPSNYWSATTFAYYPSFAWVINMFNGSIDYDTKSNLGYIWPVRGGSISSFFLPLILR